MAKAASIQHVCTECGTASMRPLGRCPGCGAFGTLVAEAPVPRGGKPLREQRTPLRLVEVVAEESERIPTGPSAGSTRGTVTMPASRRAMENDSP